MEDGGGLLGIAVPLLPPSPGKPIPRSPNLSLRPWGPHMLLLHNTLNLLFACRLLQERNPHFFFGKTAHFGEKSGLFVVVVA